MRRLLQAWFILFLANIFTGLAIGVLGYRVIDLRFEIFAQTILVPWLQAIAIWPLVRTSSGVSIFSAVKDAIRRQPVLGLFFLADAFTLILSWRLGSDSWESIGESWRTAQLYIGLKAVVGGLLLGLLAISLWRRRNVAFWAALLGSCLVVFGSDCFLDWSASVSGLISVRWPWSQHLPLLEAVVFLGSLAVMLGAEKAWRPAAPQAARILEMSVPFVIGVATIWVIGTFNNPTPLPVWAQLARTSAFLLMSGIWTSVWHLKQEVSLPSVSE